MQGGPANNATAGKVAHTVSLELAPEQVKKITVAEQLGKLSLAVRSAVEQQDTGGHRHYVQLRCVAGNCPPECNCRPDTTVVVYAGDKVKNTRSRNTMALRVSCDGSPKIARQSATVVVTQTIRNTQSSCRRNSDER